MEPQKIKNSWNTNTNKKQQHLTNSWRAGRGGHPSQSRKKKEDWKTNSENPKGWTVGAIIRDLDVYIKDKGWHDIHHNNNKNSHKNNNNHLKKNDSNKNKQ